MNLKNIVKNEVTELTIDTYSKIEFHDVPFVGINVRFDKNYE